jgi:predicted nuclease with TOPRIM domain
MQLRRSKQPTPEDRVESLEARVTHLEAMIEGLQDAVHRMAVRSNERLDEMERNIEPAELSRRISKDARERGL